MRQQGTEAQGQGLQGDKVLETARSAADWDPSSGQLA